MTSDTKTDCALARVGFVERQRRIEDAGLAYEVYLILDKLVLGLSATPVLRDEHHPHFEKSPSEENVNDTAVDDSEFDEDCDKYRKYLKSLCPKTWKNQDHYKVLGLSKLRYKASAAQIKSAYRQKVLRYHPDKGKYKDQLGEQANDTFACIQKAYELMSDNDKRRSYDSVDPDFDETVPVSVEVSTKNFFTKLAPVYERNARFSNVQPVPLLGDIHASREDVEKFYDFWFSFSSWREFSYNDTEDKSKGEDRYERREIEKMNRYEREKARKDYLKRLANTIQLTFDKDPRIALFRKAEKQAKEDEKERKRLEKLRKEEEKKAAEAEEERLKAEQLAKEKELKKLADRERNAAKKLTTRKRKELRDLVSSTNYWTEDPGEKLVIMEHVERICMAGKNDDLDDAVAKLSEAKDYDDAVAVLTGTARKEKENSTPPAKEAPQPKTESKPSSGGWTDEEIAFLVKAANLYPAGTNRRWFQVAQYINDHTRSGTPKSEKEVIKQAKIRAAQVTAPTVSAAAAAAAVTKENIQTPEPEQNHEAEAPAAKKEKSKEPSPAATNGNAAPAAATNGNAAPAPAAIADDWTPDEQFKFEQALKTYPSSDPKRWENIAAASGHTKKECIQRYKKIVEMIKARKA
uniref:DnaJ homolog subfamily C member 2 n=1 Tax=Panagrellus redivivus TaxID=6233 RepID=A0A7E4V6B1_PANRE